MATSVSALGRRSLLRVAIAFALPVLWACDADSPLGPDDDTRPPLRPLGAIATASHVEFVVHAHSDDWQLFMGDRAYAALQTGGKVVFVYTTAGDAGNPDPRYWQTRELAAHTSVDAIAGAASWTCVSETINGHPIQRCARDAGRIVSYFMRMPDGNHATGNGFGYGSLKRLRDDGTPTEAIDKSTTYLSWTDFLATLRGILDLEAAGVSGAELVVHAPDDDRTINPGDHPDHFATADAVRGASQTRTWNFAWYIGYATGNLPPNLSQSAMDIKRTAFVAYDNVMAGAGYETLAGLPEYQAWLARTYFRTQQSAPGTTTPAAPAGLSAQAVSTSQIALSWTDNASDESGFKVERALDNAGVAGSYSEVATLAANTASYTDGGRTAGSTYWYRVRAFNTAGNSPYSNEATATTHAPPPPPSSRVEAFVHAHPDDWMLFMGDRAQASLQSGSKLVFVYTTAGDAGFSSAQYWQTRETATHAAIDVIAGGGAWTCGTQTVAGHPIQRCVKASPNVVTYFMRLPDGNHTSGDGFGFGSLKRLRDLGTATTTRDGSTTYTSWSDFHTTLRDIIDVEAGEADGDDLIVHAPDDNRTLNVGDHPDHWATADAVRAGSTSRGWNLAWYIGYQTQNLAPNLSPSALEVKRAEFLAYDNVVASAGFGSLASDPQHQAWLERTYFRTETSSTGLVPPSALTARARGNQNVGLTWTTGNGATIDIWRDGVKLVASMANSGTYTDKVPRSRNVSYTYQVCAATLTGAANCSNTSVVGF